METSRTEKKEINALWIFVGVSLGLSVAHWVVFYLAAQADITLSKFAFGVIRSYGPTFAAMASLAYLGGRPAMRDFRTRAIRSRVPGRLLALVLLGPLVLLSIILGTVFLFEPEVFIWGDINPLKLFIIFFGLILLDGPLGEELGWRGFFLPALLKRHNAVVASLLVGAVWYLWHLPLYHADGDDLTPGFFAKYLFFILAQSMMHTWLHRRSGIVLVNVLFHNMTNYIVLIGFTLFPPLREATLDDNIYLYSTIAIGVLAAWSLSRKREASDQEGEAVRSAAGRTP